MRKSTVFTILGFVFVAAAIVFGLLVLRTTYTPKNVLTDTLGPTSAPLSTSEPMAEASETPEATAEAAPSESPAASQTPAPAGTDGPYTSPVNFQELQAINPDIYAWIEIDGTDINHPVLQSATDDTYYLTHNSDGNYSAGGSIFTEKEYNAKDFSDPVTILYGHHTMTGAIFSHLQEYFSDPKFFEKDPVINIYTPEGQLQYHVFAAVPYSDDHLLYTHDFTDADVFNVFINTVFSVRDLGAHFNEEYRPEPDDRVLILSTCYQGTSGRFLVMGTLVP